MDTLTSAARRELRARAHHLRPVVAIGHHGLTPAVLHEIDVALNAHELVKLRVLDDDRDARERLLATISKELGCAPVQHLGKLLIVWRKRSVTEAAKPAKPARRTKTAPATAPAPAPATAPARAIAADASRRRKTEPAALAGAARRRRADPAETAETVQAERARGAPSGRRAPAGVARAAPRRRRRD